MLLKALLLGAPGVGKTQLFRRLCTGEVFDSSYVPSTGPDFSGTTVTLASGEESVLQIWDHPGLIGAAGLSPNPADQQRMAQLMSGVHVALLVCDVTSAYSLSYLSPLITMLRTVNARESNANASVTPPPQQPQNVAATSPGATSSIALVLLVHKAEPHLRPAQQLHPAALLSFCAAHGVDLVLETSAALDTNIALLAAETAAVGALMSRRRRRLEVDPHAWRARADTHAAALRARAEEQSIEDAERAHRAEEAAAAAERARLARLAEEEAERVRRRPVPDYALLAKQRLEASWGVDDLARVLAPRVRFDLETCGRLRALFPAASPEIPLSAFRGFLRTIRAGVWAADGVCERLFLMLLKLQNVVALPSRLYLPSAPLVPLGAAPPRNSNNNNTSSTGVGASYGPPAPSSLGNGNGNSNGSNNNATAQSVSSSSSSSSAISGGNGRSADAAVNSGTSAAHTAAGGGGRGAGSAVARLAASSPATPLCGRSLATPLSAHGAAHALLGYPTFLLGLDALLHGAPAQRALIAWATVEDLAHAHAAAETAHAAVASAVAAERGAAAGASSSSAAAAAAAAAAGADGLGAAAGGAAGGGNGGRVGGSGGAAGRPRSRQQAEGAGARGLHPPGPGSDADAGDNARAHGHLHAHGHGQQGQRGGGGKRGGGGGANAGGSSVNKIAPKNTTNFDLLLRFVLTNMEASPAFAAAVVATSTPPVELVRSLLPTARKAVTTFLTSLGKSYSYTITKAEFIAGVTAQPELLAPWALSSALCFAPCRGPAFDALAAADAATAAAAAGAALAPLAPTATATVTATATPVAAAAAAEAGAQ